MAIRRRPVASVADDVRNGLVSREGARLEYGVVIDGNGQVDDAATVRAAPHIDRPPLSYLEPSS